MVSKKEKKRQGNEVDLLPLLAFLLPGLEEAQKQGKGMSKRTRPYNLFPALLRAHCIPCKPLKGSLFDVPVAQLSLGESCLHSLLTLSHSLFFFSNPTHRSSDTTTPPSS